MSAAPPEGEDTEPLDRLVPGHPCSAIVGMSGAASDRLALVTP